MCFRDINSLVLSQYEGGEGLWIRELCLVRVQSAESNASGKPPALTWRMPRPLHALDTLGQRG